jgi:hypothetical protein
MMKSILLFILLPGCSIYLTAYSNESVSGPILGTLYVAGLLGTIAASVWFQGPCFSDDIHDLYVGVFL